MNLAAIIVIVAVVVNLIVEVASIRSRRNAPEVEKPFELRCVCDHLYTSHRAGKCRDANRRVHYYNNGDRNGYEWTECPCNGYLGPDPAILGHWSPGMPSPQFPSSKTKHKEAMEEL